MNAVTRYLDLRNSVPPEVKIVAVSKFNPINVIRELYEVTGHLEFGESRVQELILKQPELPASLHWHFIGHLQTNKIKYIASFVSLIESVDSFRLLKEINKEAEKVGRKIKVLLQFHIANEESKFGLDWNEAVQFLEDVEFLKLDHITISGVMGMASFTEDHNTVRSEFRLLRSYYERLRSDYFSNEKDFSEVSMGMSGDYRIAIEEGSTMIRVGSLIFGER
jgi:pyridoxal phosphate enzyme (YggS family)